MRLTFKKKERLTGKKTFDLLFKSGKSITVPPFRLVWMETGMEEWKNGETPNIPTTRPEFISGFQHSTVFHPSNLPSFQCVLGISVPKKSFAKAVDRNTIKRRIRESYRKNKHLLHDFLLQRSGNPQKKNLRIALMFIYIAKEKLPCHEIEKKMIVSLQKLMTQMGIME